MKSADWLGRLLKALGLSALALVAYVAFFLYAAGTFWSNSEVTVTSEQQDGLSVSLTHPAVVKGRGNAMTMTVFNHTSEPVTVAEPFNCFLVENQPSFVDSRGQVQRTAGDMACTMIALAPITIPAGGSESGEVWLSTEGLPADSYKVTYNILLRRIVGKELTDNTSYQQIALNVMTQVRVVPWWWLF